MNKKTFILSIPILFVVGVTFCFMYTGSGNSPFIGIISPIDESVVEYTKLVFLPVILWWLFIYCDNHEFLEKEPWFTASLISVIVSIILIFIFNGFYTVLFRKNFIIIDVLMYIFVLLLGQFSGKYAYNKSVRLNLRITAIIYIIILTVFAIATAVKLT